MNREYTYTIDGRTWTLDYDALTLDDWLAAERVTGQHWGQIALAIDTRSAMGLKVGLWLARRREQPALGFNSPEMRVRPADLGFTHTGGADEEGEQSLDPPSDDGLSPSDDSSTAA